MKLRVWEGEVREGGRRKGGRRKKGRIHMGRKEERENKGKKECTSEE